MRLIQLATAIALLLGTTVLAQQTDLTGRWEATFTGPVGPRPKMFDKVVLDLKVEDGTVTGVARAGSWPGEAPISDGVVEGNRVSFTMIGRRTSTSGYPKLDFEGTVQGDRMILTMTWGYVRTDPASARRLPMEAKKVPNGALPQTAVSR